MRLDHLLSRERTEEESEVHSRSIQRKLCREPEGSKTNKKPTSVGRMTVHLLEPVSFSGIGSESLRNLICTLKTAQPDGKHLVKKPVAKLWKQSMRAEMRTILQLVSGERNYQRLRKRSFDSYSD